MAEYPDIIKVIKQDTFDQWRLKHNLLIDAMNILDANIGEFGDLFVEGSSLVDVANNLWKKVKANEANIGDLDLLQTEIKDNLVAAINSLKEEREDIIGNIAELITDDITNLVAAINSIDINLGKRRDLTTEVTTDVVSALNRISARLGDLSQLKTDTTARDTLVDAVNNVLEKIGGADLSLLQTDNRSSLINSINWIVGEINHLENLINTNDTNIGTLSSLVTTNQDNVVNAINEIHDTVGNLTDLNTNIKYSLVHAINEIHEEIGNRDHLSTNHKATIVGAINEINIWQKNASDDLFYQGKVAIGKETVDAGALLDVNGTVKATKFEGNLEGNVIGNVTGDIYGDVTGTATKWANPITLQLTGDVVGSASFDGSANVTLNTTFPDGPFAPAGHNHDGEYVNIRDKREGIHVNVYANGAANAPTTGLSYAFSKYSRSRFNTGDFLFVDRKHETIRYGYGCSYTGCISRQYYRDIWLKYTNSTTANSSWMLMSTTRIG